MEVRAGEGLRSGDWRARARTLLLQHESILRVLVSECIACLYNRHAYDSFTYVWEVRLCSAVLAQVVNVQSLFPQRGIRTVVY